MITVYNADWRPRRHASGTAAGSAGRIGRRSKGIKTMSGTIKHGCLVAAGIAIAALAAGNAHAGKPMNVLQKKAAADAMAREYQAQQAAKGFAAKSAPATIVAAGSGSEATQVPDDLHNYLHARVDANGQVRILESDGPTTPAEEANHD